AADHLFGAVGAAIAGAAPGYLFLAFVRLYYAPETHLSRVVALLDLLLLAAWFTMSRLAVLAALARLGRTTRVLLIGALESCRAMAHEIRAHGPKLIEVAGIATWKDEGGEALGRADELGALLERCPAEQAILDAGDASQGELRDVLFQCDRWGVELFLYPDLSFAALATARTVSIAGLPLVSLNSALATGPYRVVKRLMDAVISAALLVLTMPVWLVAAITVKATPGPVLFTQERLGLDGRPFRVYKFRTMIEDAESDSGPVLSAGGDPRITPAGRLLRRFRIDEIPQLWNVLRGDMSLVGPRPERAAFVEQYTAENPLYERRLLVKPGLTGLAQVHGRYDTGYAQKLRYDLLYINSASFAMDLRILASTVRTVLTGRGAI
ncbi:MAG: Sugar transferase, partial [Candidatus Hydrogenedentes bacterium]|nr:Sugar transferase [Candidatus Hydrogenedentota bacterium]